MHRLASVSFGEGASLTGVRIGRPDLHVVRRRMVLGDVVAQGPCAAAPADSQLFHGYAIHIQFVCSRGDLARRGRGRLSSVAGAGVAAGVLRPHP